MVRDGQELGGRWCSAAAVVLCCSAAATPPSPAAGGRLREFWWHNGNGATLQCRSKRAHAEAGGDWGTCEQPEQDQQLPPQCMLPDQKCVFEKQQENYLSLNGDQILLLLGLRTFSSKQNTTTALHVMLANLIRSCSHMMPAKS